MKMRSMGEKGPENTVMSLRASRDVARGLRARGWAVTGALCRGKTPAQVAKILCGPEAPYTAAKLTREIAVMCGYVPSVEVERG